MTPAQYRAVYEDEYIRLKLSEGEYLIEGKDGRILRCIIHKEEGEEEEEAMPEAEAIRRWETEVLRIWELVYEDDWLLFMRHKEIKAAYALINKPEDAIYGILALDRGLEE